MNNGEPYIARWQSAGLLDESTASAIRAYELIQARPAGRQWQVIAALTLGAILLAAGVLLFVAAHWDRVSPLSRTLLVLSMLVFFHGLAILVRERFSGLATALHAIGTVSAGAAIALIGQIFNMQEHWPAAILLWALCATAGWFLLRDQFQQTLTLLLVPAWIISEYADRVDGYTGAEVYIGRIVAIIAALYVAAFLNSRRRAVFGILFTVGAIQLAISIGILGDGNGFDGFGQQWGFVPISYRIAAFAIMLAVAIAGYLLDKQSIVPVGTVAVLAIALPWARTKISEAPSHAWVHTGPSLLAYILTAAAAVALVWWGVHISARALVNYGIVAFALTVMWFYFSSVMDKLGRSLGLIMLGVLFLAGGWLLERTRRRLVAGMDYTTTEAVP